MLATLVASVVLAGCLGGEDDGDDMPTSATQWLDISAIPLTEPRFEALDGESVWIEASTDGAMLHAVLWRPDTGSEPDWKSPVILVDTPYKTLVTREDPLDATEGMNIESFDWLIDELVPRGYAVAFKDVRGTSESDGCLEQTAPTQRQDGYDAVEYFGTQEWSNGKVGMYGISYLAETQYGAAILAPPHLTTIVPVASVSGQYEWNFYDGVPFTLQTLQGNAIYLALSGAPPGTTPQGLQNYPFHYECQAEMMAKGLDVSGDWDAYWDDRELRQHFGDIEASVLYVHGLQDWNVRQVAVRESFEHIQSEKRLMMGQWRHDFPDDNSYNADWNRTDWRHMVHAWYDHWLLGIDNGILERLPPVQVQDSQGAWRAETTYPPADAANFTLYLAPDALTSDQPEAWSATLRENEEAFLRAQRVPLPDVPTPQATELVFTSEPLDRDVRFSGWPVLEFDMALFDGLYPDPDSEIDAHFAANLYIDGCDQASWINAGYLSARHRDGVDAPSPVPEDETIRYTLRFHPGDTVIPAGCSVRLTFAGSDGETQPEGSFWSGEMTWGTLHFPAIERDLNEVGLDVPMSA